MSKRLFVGILILLVALNQWVKAQKPSSEILQEIQKINTIGSVLYVAAHPDDENTRLISWLVGEKHLRTAYLSLTRGDGGQNLIGKELGPSLGLIRSQELLAARNVDGAEQFFTRAYDFGFSKNADETLKIWNQDSVLYDMVWVIRKFKPDVIICRFPPNSDAGHGHHAASAILAKKAFSMAGDPKVFPDQLKYLQVWQPRRLFWNTYNFGTVNTTSEQQLTADVGVFNPLLGKSYGEIAAESRSQHKSQGFGSASNRGEIKEYFVQWEGDSAKGDLFSGIATDWSRINGSAPIQALLKQIMNGYDVKNPSQSVPMLLKLRKSILQLSKNYDAKTVEGTWLLYQLSKTEQTLLQCAGIWAEAISPQTTYVRGDSIAVKLEAVSRYSGKVEWKEFTVAGKTFPIDKMAVMNQLQTVAAPVKVPIDSKFSSPYWLEQAIEDGIFNFRDKLLTGSPQNDAAMYAHLKLLIDGDTLNVKLPVLYRYLDATEGDRYKPLRILPPLTLNFEDPVMIFSNGTAQEIRFSITAHSANVNGEVKLNLPDAWKRIDTLPLNFQLKAAGASANFSVLIKPDHSAREGSLSIYSEISGQKCNQSLKAISYDHIPQQSILPEATLKLVPLTINRNFQTIGYIPGAGDEIPTALRQLGYEVKILDEQYPLEQGFSKFDAIVSGIRAYNTHEYLNKWYEPLMDYVKNGGRLLVQYNTNNRIGPLVAKMSPYPFTITRDRVTEEDAKIGFVDSNSILLQKPNKITASDFENWVQERGIYFVGERDSNFKSVLLMNDTGEKPLDGSVVYTRYGNGYFAYTGLSFFRQLPAGVSGAYRLFVNLLEGVSISE